MPPTILVKLSEAFGSLGNWQKKTYTSIQFILIDITHFRRILLHFGIVLVNRGKPIGGYCCLTIAPPGVTLTTCVGWKTHMAWNCLIIMTHLKLHSLLFIINHIIWKHWSFLMNFCRPWCALLVYFLETKLPKSRLSFKMRMFYRIILIQYYEIW